MKYDMISENTESTVVAEFEAGDYSSAQYQSEAAMEADFIERLQRQAYEYLPIKCEADLIANLRTQIEKLNQMQFTDKEWTAFFKQHLGTPTRASWKKPAPFKKTIKRCSLATMARF